MVSTYSQCRRGVQHPRVVMQPAGKRGNSLWYDLSKDEKDQSRTWNRILNKTATQQILQSLMAPTFILSEDLRCPLGWDSD